jgi:hypothetical protein
MVNIEENGDIITLETKQSSVNFEYKEFLEFREFLENKGDKQVDNIISSTIDNAKVSCIFCQSIIVDSVALSIFFKNQETLFNLHMGCTDDLVDEIDSFISKKPGLFSHLL